jgi:hypothetical protein
VRRALLAKLPTGVYSIRKPTGKEYFYYQRNRGRPDHGPNVALPEPGTPEFYAKLAELTGTDGGDAKPMSFDALIAEYKTHPKYTHLAVNSKKSYGLCLDYISKRWGPLRVDGLTPPAIQKFLDEEFIDHAPMGNLTLSVLKTILKFGVPRGYSATNPAREIEDLDAEANSARPWPEQLWQKVVAKGPTEIARLAVLGRATGQRISDLIKMRPLHRDGAGILVSIKKLRGKEHWAGPLAPAYIAMIDGWGVFKGSTYLADERGRPFTEGALRKRLDKFTAKHSDFAAADLKPHGLRALAVCDRRIAGEAHQRISAAIGMSLRQVMHYSRHIDQRLAAGEEREQNEALKTQGPEIANSEG